MRTGKLLAVDTENIAEEIEDMGKNLKRELENRLKLLFAHSLKWEYTNPGNRGSSWRYSIEKQRAELEDHLKDEPKPCGQATESHGAWL